MKTLTTKTLTDIEEIDTELATNHLSLSRFLYLANQYQLSDQLVTTIVLGNWSEKTTITPNDYDTIRKMLKDGSRRHVFKVHPDDFIRRLCVENHRACPDVLDDLVHDKSEHVRMAFLDEPNQYILDKYYRILAKDPNPNIRMRIAYQAYFLKDLVLDDDPNVSFAALQTIANCNKMSDKLFQDILKEVKYNQDFLIEETVNPTLLKHFSEHAQEVEDRKKAKFKLNMLYKVQDLKQEMIQSEFIDPDDVGNFIYQLFYAF